MNFLDSLYVDTCGGAKLRLEAKGGLYEQHIPADHRKIELARKKRRHEPVSKIDTKCGEDNHSLIQIAVDKNEDTGSRQRAVHCMLRH